MHKKCFLRRSFPVLVHSSPMPSKFIFRSRCEEKKVYEYLANLISSGFLRYKPLQLLHFAGSIIGKKKINTELKRVFPCKKEDDNNDQWHADDEFLEKVPKKAIQQLLKGFVLSLLKQKLEKLSEYHDTALEGRLHNIHKVFKVTNHETAILFFYYLLSTSPILSGYFKDSFGLGNDTTLIDFSSLLAFKSYGHIVLGLNHRVLIKTLSQGNLFKIGLLTLDEDDRSLIISDWCREYLSGVNKKEIEHEFFTRENDVNLHMHDFELTKDDILVLKDLLKEKGKCNILLYGVPGTGKTSLAKAAAKEFGKELLTVKVPESDEHKNRLQAIYATLNIADKERSIILIDEADEILNTFDSFFSQGRTNKSWINNLIDTHDRKVIWITNRVTEIDPSTMRRFSFSMEFRNFTAKDRMKVLKYELEKNGLENFFSETALKDFCENYAVDAGGIVNALNLFRAGKTKNKGLALRKIKVVLQNHEKATGQKKSQLQRKKSFEHYSINGLNTSHNLGEFIQMSKRFAKAKEESTNKRSLSLLLYGLPGTGKSEFVHYLGNLVDKEVALRRASDIQSKYVGETEKNIAEAFHRAQEDNHILFFDEADSFLYPRKEAVRSWEKSFTNEILAQLDFYTGIVVFATNDIEGLDHAALRRFNFKIEFRPLTPEGNLHFYKKVLAPFIEKGDNLTQDQIVRIRNLSNLTPGDFAVVKNQATFQSGMQLSHDSLIEALQAEISHRMESKGQIGFLKGEE